MSSDCTRVIDLRRKPALRATEVSLVRAPWHLPRRSRSRESVPKHVVAGPRKRLMC
jgi:hypothetical protein